MKIKLTQQLTEVLATAEKIHGQSLQMQNAYLQGVTLSTVSKFPSFRVYSSGDVDRHLTRYGIFNPSVRRKGDSLDLICRAEPSETTWGGHFIDEKAVPFYTKLRIKNNTVVKETSAVALTGGTVMSARAEDWRLFEGVDGELYTNYTNYCYYNKGWPQQDTRSTTCVSRINGNRLEHLRELDVSQFKEPNAEEKNWVIFSHKGRMYCLYSLEPYLLLEMDDDFTMKRVAVSDDARVPRINLNYLANGTNPVLTTHPRFGKHYLLFGHTFTHSPTSNKRNRTYWHYAYVIDYETLALVGATPYPVIGGGGRQGRPDNIMYVSGTAVYRHNVWLFYGEGDEHTECCVIPKKTLYRNIYRL